METDTRSRARSLQELYTDFISSTKLEVRAKIGGHGDRRVGLGLADIKVMTSSSFPNENKNWKH